MDPTAETENAYQALADSSPDGDARWAYGTGFDDPLSGVDTTVPDGVEPADLAAYCLMLGDDALICAQRLTEWCSRAPELEEEVALANVGLDLLGQARLLLSRAGAADPAVLPASATNLPTEDALAYFRDEGQFRNVRLAELAGGDFARSMARLLVFSTWRLALLTRLTGSRDAVLAAVAAKGVKELAYHRDYAAGWVVRLGDGTDESHDRMQRGLDEVWPFVDELFAVSDVERRVAAAGVGVSPDELRAECDAVLAEVIDTALLRTPEVAGLAGVSGRMGRDGIHTEAMGHLLAELQSLARAHPEATW